MRTSFPLKAPLWLVLIFTVALVNNALASHQMGIELLYQPIGNDVYKVKALIYRDCNGIDQLTHDIVIFSKCDSMMLTLPRVSLKDVTNLCFGDRNRCQGSGSGFPYGVQLLTFEGMADLSEWRAKGCCNIGLSSIILVSKDATGTLLPVYQEVSFDLCKIENDKIPEWKESWPVLSCQGTTQRIHNKVSNPEGYELSYSLDTVWQTPTKIWNYTSGYTPKAPFYFDGFPQTDLKWPSGLGFNPNTGSITFKPAKVENATLKLTMTYSKAGIVYGKLSRDMPLLVIKCPSALEASLSGINCKPATEFNVKTEAFPGVKLCFSQCADSKNLNDTLQLETEDTIAGASWRRLNPGDKMENAQFCWTPTMAQTRLDPYYFTVSAYSDQCHEPKYTQQTYEITILEMVDFTFAVEVGDCGTIKTLVNNTSGVEIVMWKYKITGYDISHRGFNIDSVEFKGLAAGNHKLSVIAWGANGSVQSKEFTLTMKNSGIFNRSKVVLPQCPNETVNINAGNYVVNGASMEWVDTKSSDPIRQFHEVADKIYPIYGQLGVCKDTLKVIANVLDLKPEFTANSVNATAPFNCVFKLKQPNDFTDIIFYPGTGDSIRMLATDSIQYVYNKTGTYDVKMRAFYHGKKCTDFTLKEKYITILPSSMDETQEKHFHFYPNPVKTTLVIESKDQTKGQWQLFDLQGQVLLHGVYFGSDPVTVDLTQLTQGIYLLRRMDDTGIVGNGMVVKE